MRNKKGFKNLPIRPIRTAIKVTQSNFILIQFFVTLLTFYLLLEEHVAPIKSESNSRKFKHLPTKCVTVTQQQHCRSCRGSSSALFVLFFFQSFLKWIQLDWQHCVNHFHIERTRIFYNEGGPFVTTTQDVARGAKHNKVFSCVDLWVSPDQRVPTGMLDANAAYANVS